MTELWAQSAGAAWAQSADRTPYDAACDLALTTLREDDSLLVWLRGDLDARTNDVLLGSCRSWADDGVREVVLDLADVTGVDGHGLATLLRSRRLMRSRAGTLRVVNAPVEAAETMARTGIFFGQRSPLD